MSGQSPTEGQVKWFANSVKRHQWIFAKTMPENPHEYTLRREWSDEAEFVRGVELIREFGFDDPFGGKTYRALVADGFKYWTMGAPFDKTILINRKPAGVR